ncbi:amino acid decarboxylase [Mycobacterium intracellulare]|uniref:amino acid decarboxylase n=1 Tax=Mycobacterium intracellulare TaxID=1767 RepID=UPI0006CA75D0|nr:amino acid decarboxylase [Mycobacterium intracellulare]KPN48135.1 amino acid decarboxylase [Mycobacterium intracellulare subsp. chimaera]
MPAWFRQAVADRSLLADLAHGIGGPFHVLFPPRFARNVKDFSNVLASSGVDGQVFFAKKANKAGCWLQVCADTGAGVDVSSAPELVHALSRGVRGCDIVVTGPAKSEHLLWLASRHGALIAVDAHDELDRVIALARRGEIVRILLRVLPKANPDSRFGFHPAELDIALMRCALQRSRLSMEGFSFHLNGYQVKPRAELAAHLVDRLVAARTRGLAATSISIGGGFAVSYLDSDTWARFLRDGKQTDFHARKAFTHFYPYHQSPTGAEMLAAILSSETGCGTGTVAQKMIKTGTKLLIEPGRALLDGAGFTVFPVQGFKRRGDYGIVTVNGLSMSLSEQWKSSEFLPDPMLWPEQCPDELQATSPIRTCVGGASCLEYDMLTWRKVVLAREPRHGDLLVYPNTAGYQMDKNESEFHLLRLPPKVVLTLDDGRFRWHLDENGYQQ